MHCYVHTYVHTHVPRGASCLVRASLTTRPRGGASAGPCERGGGGPHSVFRLGQSAAAGSAASSVSSASLRANRAAAPGGSGPPRTRAGRLRAPDTRARGRRPTTGNAAAASNAARLGPSARRGSATRSSAAPAPPRTRTAAAAAGAGRTVPPRACTGRATRGAPSPSWSGCSCRAPRARAAAPAAHQWADVRSNGPQPWKGAAHALNTHPHARDRHTDAFGAAIVP
jgi:hypothetical protein